MMKISKNIKRLRNAQNLSQEALAEKLFISRQAVSSWENDRTQPDIEMLGKLSEVFNVSVEELIYGEKRKTHIDNNDDTSGNKKLIIIFSSLGSVFIAIGIICFIFFGWEKFNITIKTVFAMLPMLVGQASAIYTYYKKKSSVAWCEGAAIIWATGVTASVFLVNTIFNINISLFTLMLISALLVLPTIYILKSVSPLVGFYGLILFAIPNSINIYVGLSTWIFLIISSFFITSHFKDKVEDFRHNYSIWITVISIFISLVEFVIVMNSSLYYIASFPLFLSFFTALFVYSKTTDISKPYYILGTLGLTATTVFITFLDDFHSIDVIFTDSTFEETPISLYIIQVILCAGFILWGVISGRKNLVKNPLKISILLCGISATITSLICGDVFVPVALLICVALALCFIITGAKANRFYEMNLGLLTFIVLIFRVITDLNADYLAVGFTFFASGIILFTFNFLLSRRNKEIKKKLVNTDNEISNGGETDV
ncbi:MAG: DUF2157 domain-containing protein [Clostridia bacterium]|nr:DUF2157 domain-containing protein [Clostridia bacterium]